MANISNDLEFRNALNGLSAQEQRVVAGRLVESVLHLCRDPLVSRAVELALNDSSPAAEIEQSWRAVKAYAVTKYTDCGKPADWLSQAEHFVASAAAVSLQPEDGNQRAWKAAMEIRMAKTCEMIASGEAEAANEAEQQYALLEKYLSES